MQLTGSTQGSTAVPNPSGRGPLGWREHVETPAHRPSTHLSPTSLLSGILTTSIRQPARSLQWLRFGGDMLFKIALVLLAVWLLGVVGLFTIGDLIHVLLLAGLALLLLAVLKARDAAMRRMVGGPSEKP